MLYRLRRSLRRFFNRSRTVNNEPLNKVSLVVVIVIDIVILTNVFVGLNDIGQWHISPSEAYPCYAEWDTYRGDNTAENKNVEFVRRAADKTSIDLTPGYTQAAVDRLGTVSQLCLQYADARTAVKQSENMALLETLAQTETAIATLENTNYTIRQQYDSTLLEEIADQPREQSINLTSAAQAKADLAQNEAQINTLKSEILRLQDKLLSTPGSVTFLSFLNQDSTFQTVEQGYDKANFWYPSIQLIFQAVFLVPLILLAFAGYTIAQRKHYGLIALISWHLLVIFFIPLLLKIFEFMQMGVIFKALVDLVSLLFGRLLFLVSYIYIVLIPLLGFGVIKFAQRFMFNPKLQAAGRIQKSRCIKCAKKLKDHDTHCPYCGYQQHQNCGHCHQPTYKYLPYCNHCGTPQAVQTVHVD